MADPSLTAGLLDRAGHVFSLASQLGQMFRDAQLGRRSQPNSFELDSHGQTFEQFTAAVLELREVIERTPEGSVPVVDALREAALVARQIREAMKRSKAYALYLDFFPHLNSVAAAGWNALAAMRKAQRSEDPFAFLDQLAAGAGDTTGIDTTPTVPKPPEALIEAASRAIPGVLANIPPDRAGTIGLLAAHLAKQLQDAKHSLAAAHWAIHETVRVGRLRAGLVEVELPGIGVPNLGWGGPAHHWHGGGRGTKAIPKGKPAPFDCFKVIATDALWAWWRALDAVEPSETPTDESGERVEPVRAHTPTEVTSNHTKRSTERGEGRAKLIASLTKHHQYAAGGALNQNPIGNNELARLAGVSESTASAFFNSAFKGHMKYRAICRDVSKLAATLKLLNNEFAPHALFGKTPNEDDRDEE